MEYNEDCAVCKNHYEFEMPEEIVESIKDGNLVIFAGAGISTEGRGVFPRSLYSEIALEMGKVNPEESFSTLMEEYTSKPNGRIKLIRKFLDRLDYVEAFPEMSKWACKFHNELSTLHSVNEIITTNWDNYFEDYCGCSAFVTSKDFALSNTKKRKVYKIHGSISNFGSIVATSTDYDECYKELQSGLIGSKLKLLLSNPEKTIVFVGYSLTDEDFQRIMEYLESELGDFMPHYYVVSLDDTIGERLEKKKFTPIITDATYFLQKLKYRLLDDNFMNSDELYSYAMAALGFITDVHLKLSGESIEKNPDYVYSLCYQDGLIHSYQRIVALKKTGYYSCKENVDKSIRGYSNLSKKAADDKLYYEQAYLDGYLNGLISIAEGSFEMIPPLYYLFVEHDSYTLEEYNEKKTEFFAENPEILEYVKGIRAKHGDIVLHHRPLL